MNIDITKSPEANLCALINADNPELNLTPETVQFATPAPRTPDAENARNTSIGLTTVSEEPKSDTVRYTRLDLTQSVETVVTEFAVESATTLEELKTEVAEALKLVASEFDLTGDLPAAGETATITATAKANSLLYLATPLALSVTNTDTPPAAPTTPESDETQSTGESQEPAATIVSTEPQSSDASEEPLALPSDVTDPQKETA